MQHMCCDVVRGSPTPEEEIRILRSARQDLPGTTYLEFDVPRLGSRIGAEPPI